MKKSLKEWCADHKKELVITGIVIGAVTGGVLIIKNWDSFAKFVNPTTKIAPLPQNNGMLPELPIEAEPPVLKIIDVREYVRNLPEGQHHSEVKYEQALKLGIVLPKNQTLVSAHPRCCAA